ncbi:hypothetical protein RB598_000352 [Gaeumannomyces tritici]
MAFPADPAQWQEEIAASDLGGQSIHDGEFTASASKATWDQFLLLRALYINDKPKSASLLDEGPLLDDSGYIQDAKTALQDKDTSNATGWEAYLFNLGHLRQTAATDRPFPCLKSFSLPRYFQLLAANPQGLNDDDDDDDNDSVMAYYAPPTRSDACGGSDTGNMSAIVNRSFPETPTRTRDAMDVDVAGDAPASSPDSGSSVASPPRNRILFAPVSPVPVTAEEAKQLKAGLDEQIVNSALVMFLIAITIHHKGVKGAWSPHRHPFTIYTGQPSRENKIFTAVVDGYFATFPGPGRMPEITAIAEVKPHHREAEINGIRMQEACQLAAWISQYPPRDDQYKHGLEKYARRVLVSQNRDEIYITIATFDKSYTEYITGARPQMSGQTSFLRLVEYGPYLTNNKDQMEKFAVIILAFCLQS